MHGFVFWAVYAYVFHLAWCQRYQLRLDGAIDAVLVNNLRSLKSSSDQLAKSPWRLMRTLFVDRMGVTSTLTVDYDHLTETTSLPNALSRVFDADDTFDYGLTAHLFTSTSTSSANSDPSTLDVHVLLHAATDVPAFLSSNSTEICILVAFKSDTLQSHSVCSLSWPYDTVCIVGRSLDRRWFIGNKSVNVSFSIKPVASSSYCTVNSHDPHETNRVWHKIGRIASPNANSPLAFSSKTPHNHHPVELSSSEVGRGKAQVSLYLPPRDAFFRAGDLLRLPVYLIPGNSLASLLIRVNASPSLQLSEMRLLHPDWRLSIISDSNNRVAVIRATADPTSNSSAQLGGPLLEYDFRVVTTPSQKHEATGKSTSPTGTESDKQQDQKNRPWTSLDSFTDEVVMGRGGDSSPPSPPGTSTPAMTTAGLTWEVEMVSRDSAAVGMAAVDALFRLDNDPIVALIPVAKVSRIFNYAVLRDSIQRMPIWVYGFTAQSGLIQIWDGECTSSDPEVVKVESLCRFLYLDGSETRGSENVTIKITRRRLTATIELSVLFPELPLRLDISDVNLQVIRNFLVPAPGAGKKGSKSDSSPKCRSHYQRATIRAFARFSYNPHAVSSLVIDAEVTDWVRPLVRVQNATIADFDGSSLVGLAPGQTLIQLITAAGQLIGSRPITVSSSLPVSITRLDALIADRIDIHITPSQSLPSRSFVADNIVDKQQKSAFFDVTASLRRVTSAGNRADEPTASPSRLFVVAHFSDGTYLDLATLPSNWYELSIQPAPNADVAVPRVALFEVAKCRRQSVDEAHFASTAEPQVTVSPLSVIRIDGSMFQTEFGSPSDTEIDETVMVQRPILAVSHFESSSSTGKNPSSDSTTIALGVVLGILLVFLLVLTIIAFRRRISVVISPYVNSDTPIISHICGLYQSALNSRITKAAIIFVNAQLTRHRNPANRAANRVVHENVAVDDDNDLQSCLGDEFETICEPASRTDRNWVWLSRETLEKHSVDTMRSHPLLPDAAFRSLCCSVGTGTGARSPAMSTTGSQASRSGRSSVAPLLKGPTILPVSSDEDNSGTHTAIDPAEDLPLYPHGAMSPGLIRNTAGISSPGRNLTPTVYTGSECSLRILPCQSPTGSSPAALQLVAPDGRLMATAFASRTLNSDHRRRMRGYANQMAHAVNRGAGSIAAWRDRGSDMIPVVTDDPTKSRQSTPSSRDQVRFSSLPKPAVDVNTVTAEMEQQPAGDGCDIFLINNGPSSPPSSSAHNNNNNDYIA